MSDPRFEGALKSLGFLVRDIRAIEPRRPGPDLESDLRWALRVLRDPFELARLAKTPIPAAREPTLAPPAAPPPERATVSTIERPAGAQAPSAPTAAAVPTTSTTPTSAFRPGTRAHVRRIQCEPPRSRSRGRPAAPAPAPAQAATEPLPPPLPTIPPPRSAPRPTPRPQAPHPALALLAAIGSAIGAQLYRLGHHLEEWDQRPARRPDCAVRQVSSAFDCGFYTGCVILAVFLLVTLWP